MAREFGSGGAEISRIVADRMNWRLLDREILDEVVRMAGVERDAAERCDERLDPLFHRLLKSLWQGGFETSTTEIGRDPFDSEEMTRCARVVIEQAASHGNCVIVGRGGAMPAGRSRGHSQRVYLGSAGVSDFTGCRERLPQEPHPEGLMDKMDRARSTFMRREFNANWWDHQPVRLDDQLCAGLRGSGRLHRRGDTGRVTRACLTGAPPEARQINPWFVAFAVMFGTFMEVLDTTVVNVALPHIAGSMSATVEEATWSLTSYLVANAIILPMTGWLASVFGRKRLVQGAVIGFTVSSMLCGFAPNLAVSHRVPDHSRRYRRHDAAALAGHHAGGVSAKRSGQGHGFLGAWDCCGADARPGAGRLADGQLLVAMGVLYQPAGRTAGVADDLPVRFRSAIPSP